MTCDKPCLCPKLWPSEILQAMMPRRTSSMTQSSPPVKKPEFEWVASLMDTENISIEVFIFAWRLSEHRGHLDLIIIKQYLLTTMSLMTEK